MPPSNSTPGSTPDIPSSYEAAPENPEAFLDQLYEELDLRIADDSEEEKHLTKLILDSGIVDTLRTERATWITLQHESLQAYAKDLSAYQLAKLKESIQKNVGHPAELRAKRIPEIMKARSAMISNILSVVPNTVDTSGLSDTTIGNRKSMQQEVEKAIEKYDQFLDNNLEFPMSVKERKELKNQIKHLNTVLIPTINRVLRNDIGKRIGTTDEDKKEAEKDWKKTKESLLNTSLRAKLYAAHDFVSHATYHNRYRRNQPSILAPALRIAGGGWAILMMITTGIPFFKMLLKDRKFSKEHFGFLAGYTGAAGLALNAFPKGAKTQLEKQEETSRKVTAFAIGMHNKEFMAILPSLNETQIVAAVKQFHLVMNEENEKEREKKIDELRDIFHGKSDRTLEEFLDAYVKKNERTELSNVLTTLGTKERQENFLNALLQLDVETKYGASLIKDNMPDWFKKARTT